MTKKDKVNVDLPETKKRRFRKWVDISLELTLKEPYRACSDLRKDRVTATFFEMRQLR